MQRGLITVAIGKKYVTQAKYLALSCMINSSSTLRAVITDFPDLLSSYYDIVINWEKDDDPFSIKTRLYDLTPFDETLFLDADSLVFNLLDSFFLHLQNKNFVYFGDKLNSGIWYFNIKEICKKIQAQWLPQLNSGMFLFNKSEISKDIFSKAFYYFTHHKDEGINIPFFRNNFYPDEPFFSISLALNGIEPLYDFGRFSRSLIDASDIHLNITKRIAFFNKDNLTVHPQVVHFCGKFGNILYVSQRIKLFFYFLNPLQRFICKVLLSINNLFHKQ